MTDPVDQLLQKLAESTSLRRRIRYLLLLFAAATMTILIAALWITNHDLPARTQTAFAAMVALGTGWTAYAPIALHRRGHLYALDRVIAGRLALFFAIACATGIALIVTGPSRALGVVPIIAAAAVLAHAHAHRSRLRRHLKTLQGGTP